MSEFLETLSKLEDEFDRAFLALIEHTNATGIRSEFVLDGKKYVLNIDEVEE